MSLCLLEGNTYIWFMYALVCSCVCIWVCILLRPVFASKYSWGRCVAKRQKWWLVSQLRGERFTLIKSQLALGRRRPFVLIPDDFFYFFILHCIIFEEIQKLVPPRWTHFVLLSRPEATIKSKALKVTTFYSIYNKSSFSQFIHRTTTG